MCPRLLSDGCNQDRPRSHCRRARGCGDVQVNMYSSMISAGIAEFRIRQWHQVRHEDEKRSRMPHDRLQGRPIPLKRFFSLGRSFSFDFRLACLRFRLRICVCLCFGFRLRLRAPPWRHLNGWLSRLPNVPAPAPQHLDHFGRDSSRQRYAQKDEAFVDSIRKRKLRPNTCSTLVSPGLSLLRPFPTLETH